MYDPQMLIWIDESGCDRRNSTRKRGYSFRGITPKDHRLLVRGTRYSTVPIMSMEGIHDFYITMNGEKFEQFLSFTSASTIQLGKPPFCGSNGQRIYSSCGRCRTFNHKSWGQTNFLPPYSPDLNPLEEVFSKVKGIMKDNDRLFQATSAPRPLLGMAFGMVTKNDCVAYIRHAGYV